MGAGKTRLGGALADALGLPFVDLDREIEERTGLAIRDLFARFGETYFRELEHVRLASICRLPEAVVATGGGTFAIERNRRLIEDSGTSLFLDVDFDTIAERLGEAGRAKRPLFAHPGRARELYDRRLPTYRRADLTVKVHPGDAAEEVAANMIRSIRDTPCAI